MQEQQKLETNEHFRMMADSAPVLVWISNTDKLCYVFNKCWLDFTGKTLEQQYGNSWTEGVHPDDVHHCLATYNENFDQKKPFKREYRLRRHDGNYRWLLDNGIPRFTAVGEFAGYIGSCIDIQEMKEAELTKDEFISIAGHELKTPLTTLMVAAQMLDKLFHTDPTSHYIPDLLKSSSSSLKKLESLINDLLNISAIKDGHLNLHKTNFKVYDLINECVGYFKLSSTTKFNISCAENVVIYADVKKLEQIIMNLLNNAFKYAPASGKIDITAKQTGHLIKVLVTDYGSGIPAENIPKLFDRYFRGEALLNNHVSGFGLGLYISREIIREHGGDMGVESTPGKGSTFWFTVPVNDVGQN